MNIKYTTIKLTKSDFKKLCAYYKAYQKQSSGAYIAFYAEVKDLKITAYSSTKDPLHFKVTFSGAHIESEAVKWSRSFVVNEKESVSKRQESQNFIYYGPQYGSDEVGFGDFFGPLVVVAAYLDEQAYHELSSFIIKDSKKITDDYILSHVPLLINRVPHKVNIVDNLKFNDLTAKGYNMNKIKAMLHLHVLNLLKSEININATAFIDKFASEENFAKYTEGMKPINDLVMKEKGESLYPSVALASVLARYYFLVEMDKLSTKFKTKIPLGASHLVDEFAREFVKKHGLTVLNKIVKQNFANYRRLTT